MTTPQAFDLSSTTPHYVGTMELPYSPRAMQSHQRDPISGSWYIMQAKPDGDGQTTFLTHCKFRGGVYSHMVLDQGGHGSCFGLEHEDGESLQITTRYGGSGADLVTFDYHYGQTEYENDSDFTVRNKFGHNTVVPSFDLPHGYVTYRYNSGNQTYYERRKWSEVKAGIDQTYGATITTPSLGGFVGLGDEFYWLPITTDDQDIKIEVYSWVTGLHTGTHSLAGLSADKNGNVPDGLAETEGLSVYMAPHGGMRLYVGVVNGGPGNHIAKIFALY